jgi:hypothetical protein
MLFVHVNDTCCEIFRGATEFETVLFLVDLKGF